MAFCPSCGSELEGNPRYCRECGEEIPATETQDGDVAPVTEQESNGQKSGRSFLPPNWKIGIAGAFMGIVVGGLVAWGLANTDWSAVGLVVALGSVTLFLWRKPTATGAFGSGLYIAALTLVLVPLFFYAPVLFSSDDPQTAREVGMAIGSVFGLFIWTVVFGIIAAVIGAVGYYLKKRQARKLSG